MPRKSLSSSWIYDLKDRHKKKFTKNYIIKGTSLYLCQELWCIFVLLFFFLELLLLLLLFFFFFFISYFSITSKVIRIVILIVYVLGHKYVWSPSQSHLKTILSWAQNIFMPVDINSLLFFHIWLKKVITTSCKICLTGCGIWSPSLLCSFKSKST